MTHQNLRLGKCWKLFWATLSVLFITDFNTMSLIERSLTAAISHILQYLRQFCLSVDKVGQNWPIRGYTRVLLSLPTGVLSLPLTTLFLFFQVLFNPHCAPTNWMPGRGFWRYIYTCRNNWRRLGAQNNSVETCACGSSSNSISWSSKPPQTIT